MALFRVQVAEVHTVSYTVEAASKEEALTKLKEGDWLAETSNTFEYQLEDSEPIVEAI